MLKFTPDGKVDRSLPDDLDDDALEQPSWSDLADALDECMAALRKCSNGGEGVLDAARNAFIASETLRKIGAEP